MAGENGGGSNKTVIWTAISSLVALMVLLRLLVIVPLQAEMDKIEERINSHFVWSQKEDARISVEIAKIEKVQEQGQKIADYLLGDEKKNCNQNSQAH